MDSVMNRNERRQRMSRYGDSDCDELIYYLDEFLRKHEVSELLKLVTDAVEDIEYERERKETGDEEK